MPEDEQPTFEQTMQTMGQWTPAPGTGFLVEQATHVLPYGEDLEKYVQLDEQYHSIWFHERLKQDLIQHVWAHRGNQ